LIIIVGHHYKKGRRVAEWSSHPGQGNEFIDEQGRIIDLYQQLTQIADEHLIPWMCRVGGWLSRAGSSGSFKSVESSVNGDYCGCGQFHIDPFQLGGDPAERHLFGRHFGLC
jgi:hypothetical protein